MRLPNNYALARRRLELLKRRLLKDDELRAKYSAVMRDHLAKGYVSRHMGDREVGSWYLPHHPVLNPNKPGKVRIVFDCAAQYMGHSLNTELLSGPVLTNDLTGVLLRFRKYPVALCADIQEMFLQVEVPKNDRKTLSFLWWCDEEFRSKPSIHNMNIHPFGTTSSPFCATSALRRAAFDHSQGSEDKCLNAVLENFYVDDCLISVSTIGEGIELADGLRKLLANGGFWLVKWISNCSEALRNIPVSERVESSSEFSCSMKAEQGTLGLRWVIASDSFRVALVLPQKPPTRRGILSCVASLYDPLGFTTPLTLPVRQLLQELCKSSIGWDSSLPPAYIERWQRWLTDIQSVVTLRVPRHIGLLGLNASEAQLHVFSDATVTSYGIVGYLRVRNGGGVSCHFLLGKSRVCPRKISTISKTELVAAVLAVKLNKHIVKEPRYPLDNSIVLP